MDAVERSKVRGARDMLRECAKQLRSIDATGHAELADRHADEIDGLLPPQGQGAIAEANIMYAVLAVNRHHDLLASAKVLVADRRQNGEIPGKACSHDGLDVPSSDCMMCAMILAIAKAEGL